MIAGQSIANFIGDVMTVADAELLGPGQDQYLVHFDANYVLNCHCYATTRGNHLPKCVASMSNDPTGTWSNVHNRPMYVSDSNAAVDIIEEENEPTRAVLYALSDIDPMVEIVHSYGPNCWFHAAAAAANPTRVKRVPRHDGPPPRPPSPHRGPPPPSDGGPHLREDQSIDFQDNDNRRHTRLFVFVLFQFVLLFLPSDAACACPSHWPSQFPRSANARSH